MNRFTLKGKTSAAKLNGKIKRRESEKIFVELWPAKLWSYDEGYDIFFEINRMVYQLQHNALNFIKEHRLFSILINNPSYHQSQSLYSSPQQLNYRSTISNQNDLNTEQMQAIECIVNGRYNPVPNLLYGPPGKI